MNNKMFILPIILLSLSATLSLTGCGDATQAAEVSNTETCETKESTDQLLVYGEVKIDEIEELQINFPARITNVLAKKGTIVHQGDALITLDFDDYKLEIEKLEKELEGYRLEINGLQSSTNAETANIDAISNELALKKSYVSSDQDPDILPLQNSLTTLNFDRL